MADEDGNVQSGQMVESCQLTEGCMLEDGHEGECVTEAAESDGNTEAEETSESSETVETSESSEPTPTPDVTESQESAPVSDEAEDPQPTPEITVNSAPSQAPEISLMNAGSVAEIGEQAYDSLESAIAAVQSDQTVKLTANISVAETIEINKSFTLDLNGFSITSSGTVLRVTGSGTNLIICDGSGNNTGKLESTGTSGYVVQLQNGAAAELKSGTIEALGKVTEIYPDNGCTFKMTGGVVRSGNGTWASTNTGTMQFLGGKIYAKGAGSITKKFYAIDNNILIREADGAFTIGTKDAPPTEYHVKYGDLFYDNYGTITDVGSSLYSTYKGDDGVSRVEINAEGSGSLPLVILQEGQTIAFTLNDGASISPDGTKAIKLKSGAKVTVEGTGTVAEGAIIAYDQNMEAVPTEIDGVTVYEPKAPMFYQAGESQFNDLAEAIEAALAGDGTVTLLRGATCTEAVTIPEGENIVLDLAGNTLSMTGHQKYTDATSAAEVTPAIINNGTLTIKGGEIASGEVAADVIVNTGSVTIEADATVSNAHQSYEGRGLIVNFGGTVETAGTLDSTANDGIVTYGGTVNITGGTISTTAESAAPLVIYNRAYDTDVTGGDATVTMSGGALSSAGYAVGVNRIRSGSSSLTVTGGSMTSTDRTAIYWPGAGTLTIGTSGSEAGPEITSQHGSAVEICCGTLNVYGGTLSGNGAEQEETTAELADAFRENSGSSGIGDAVTVIAQRSEGYTSAPMNINIAGGTFNSDNNCGLRYFNCNLVSGAEELTQEVAVSVTNGSFSGGLMSVDGTLLKGDESRFISGGSFSDLNASNYLEEGFELIDNGDGTHGVQEERIVQVGDDRFFNSLENAIAAVQDGETVKLLQNIELESTVTIEGKNFILDLNGKTISGSVATNGLINATMGTQLTITDLSDEVVKGSISNTGESTSRAVAVRTGSNVILDGGINISVQGTSTMAYAAALYIATNNDNAPSVTVKNANLSATKGYPIRFDSPSKAAKLTIEGGSFARPDSSSHAAQLIYYDSEDNTNIKGGTFRSWSIAMDGKLVEDGYCVAIEDTGSGGELTDTVVTVQQQAPEDYAAKIEDLNVYYLSFPEDNLFYLFDRGGEGHEYSIMKSAGRCVYPEGENVGTSTGTPLELKINLASGVNLAGTMPLEIIDVLVTGEGTVSDGFFAPADTAEFQVLCEDTADGTMYKGRLLAEKVVATVILEDGTEIGYAGLSAAVTGAKRNSGCTLRLEKDIELTASGDRQDISGVWTLDLNGHSIIYDGPGMTGSYVDGLFTVNSSNAELKVENSKPGEGGIIQSKNNTIYPFVISSRNAKDSRLVIGKDVIVKGPVLIDDFVNAVVDVYGTIDSAGIGDAAIYNNGANTENSTINLYEGAQIISDSHGIYHPGSGTLNVYGGASVTGGNVGIEMRAGTLNVYEGAVITGGDGEPGSTPNGSGSTASNAAVAISQHSGGPSVVFNSYGGTFTGGAAVYETNPQGNTGDATDKIELNIRDGMFEGKVSSETQEGFISGGTFTQEPENTDIYPGLEAVEEGQNFTVARLQDVYVSGSGDDTNNGTDAANAVQSLERAMKLVADDGTIYICGEVGINSDLTISKVNIKRADGYAGVLLRLQGAANAPITVTMEDAVIDGNKENVPASNMLVKVSQNAKLIMKDGAVLQNNGYTALGIRYGSGANAPGHAVIEGGAITGNMAPSCYGGGIYVEGKLDITGGEISGNTAAYGGGIYSTDDGTVLFSGGEIKGNEAANQGGGIAIVRGTVTMEGSASVKENISWNDGAGVYIQNASTYGDSVFDMTGGTISGNIIKESGYEGAGIYGYCDVSGDHNVIIKLSGGTIEGKDGDTHRLIALHSKREAYPRLELKGAPDIKGDIFLSDGDSQDGFKVNVTGEFDPAAPVVIERQSQEYGTVAVEYTAGLTPDVNEFEPYSASDILTAEGQNLVWTQAQVVRFYDEDGTEYTENRHGVLTGGLIDTDKVPAPAKTGYTLDGWYEKGASEPWDFAADTVDDATELYARWNLNAPEVSVTADDLTPHTGTNAVLTAVPAHELDSVGYIYQWYKDGTPVQGATGNSLKTAEAGNYTVKVTASDGSKTSAETQSAPVKITVEGHVYVPTVTKPTCTQKGYTTYTCKCGDSYIADYTEPAGHSFEWVIDKEATATEAGLKHEECTVCGYAKESVEIPATGEEGEEGGETTPTPEPTPGPTDKPQDTEKPSGTDDTKTEGKGSPETGDSSNSTLWVVVMAAAAAALAGTYGYSRKRK
jgi:uncharacterized repeat protein (TIGR02543 family)